MRATTRAWLALARVSVAAACAYSDVSHPARTNCQAGCTHSFSFDIPSGASAPLLRGL